MKTTTKVAVECSHLPVLSSRNQAWGNILVEQFQHLPGEGRTYYQDEHSICLSLAPRPVSMVQRQGDQTRTGAYRKGDCCLTPAGMPFFARWENDDRFLQMRIASRFIQSVATEALEMNSDSMELVPEFRIRDPQVEAIGMMLLTELQQENLGGRLYIESLVNVLAVHLLRQYAATKPKVPVYGGGLPQAQLRQVLAYIHDSLDQEIKLADLAALLGMSQFHFIRLFKQTIGMTPYQYLLQQRIERAKQLLQHSDRGIIDIAFLCGFNSHSHLSQQFRQLTGMTPKAYRGQC
ncbi:MAG: helix-turn-helix transcriptional regulator [Acaryochloris sp. RU_4_1]|nr:helix-turn-helix transcriptional regulator [Acaryochloris sp. RU_4_1]NJR55771.1 helix-turn-helix transcriptional regulator [Acaryochloris sp. CRU_2_0]